MKYIGTTIGCLLMLLVTIPPHGGFILGFFLIFLIPLFLYSGVRMYRFRSETKERSIKLAVWLLAIALVIIANYQRHVTTREVANNIVSKIHAYNEAHNSYPDNLEDLGYKKEELKSSLGMHGYYYKDGTPSFFYAVPYVVFDTYDYDFSSGNWIYRAD